MSETTLAELTAELRATLAPDDGLSAAEMQTVMDAGDAVREVCEAAAKRRLAAKLPQAELRVQQWERSLAAAQYQAEPTQTVLDKLNAELVECERRAGNVADAIASDDLTVRLEARTVKVACAEEAASLEAKIAYFEGQAAPHRAELARVQRDHAMAERDLAELRRGMDDPFATSVGTRTPEYAAYLRYAGACFDNPAGAVSRKILTDALAQAGILREIQRDTILAWINGDPGIRDVTGIYAADGDKRVIRQPDGSTLAITGLSSPGMEQAVEGTPSPRPLDSASPAPESMVAVSDSQSQMPVIIGRRY